ncbi:unnamed protein product [Phytomonas sp. EM1]|nr:unnamed protein product [Phytomonas sp. EM1]|eukprot:CCW63793.1 unnamed protein product [Phytomonas sp. isolate EM1]
MLKRQSLWVPVIKHNPIFAKAFHEFKKSSPITNLLFNGARISEEVIHVALDTDAQNPNRSVTALMAFPMLVHEDLCEGTGSDERKALACGIEVGLSDAMNSIHMMERLLPEKTPNVSVNMHAESLKPIHAGDRILVISSIDKFGKGLVYFKTDFYLEPQSVSEEILARERDITSLQGLHAALNLYEKLAHVVHLKCILKSKK